MPPKLIGIQDVQGDRRPPGRRPTQRPADAPQPDRRDGRQDDLQHHGLRSGPCPGPLRRRQSGDIPGCPRMVPDRRGGTSSPRGDAAPPANRCRAARPRNPRRRPPGSRAPARPVPLGSSPLSPPSRLGSPQFFDKRAMSSLIVVSHLTTSSAGEICSERGSGPIENPFSGEWILCLRVASKPTMMIMKR